MYVRRVHCIGNWRQKKYDFFARNLLCVGSYFSLPSGRTSYSFVQRRRLIIFVRFVKRSVPVCVCVCIRHIRFIIDMNGDSLVRNLNNRDSFVSTSNDNLVMFSIPIVFFSVAPVDTYTECKITKSPCDNVRRE